MARWSLSEFLGLLEIRSQCWCWVNLSADGGFSVRHSDSIYFYAVLGGEAKISGVRFGTVKLALGDIVIIPEGDSHAIRIEDQVQVESFDFLNTDSYADVLPVFDMGSGQPVVRLLCSRLKVRWPFGQKPESMPSLLKKEGNDSAIDVGTLEQLANNCGAAAVLTRAAGLLFTIAFSKLPESDKMFQATGTYDPIAKAKEIIEKHPFKDWTVQILATKVGMGRSSFAAHFSAEVGKTPIEYVTIQRMGHATMLLEHTELKVAAISEHVGYRSEAAFSRRFSSFFGMSPGKMRALMREQGNDATS